MDDSAPMDPWTPSHDRVAWRPVSSFHLQIAEGVPDSETADVKASFRQVRGVPGDHGQRRPTVAISIRKRLRPLRYHAGIQKKVHKPLARGSSRSRSIVAPESRKGDSAKNWARFPARCAFRSHSSASATVQVSLSPAMLPHQRRSLYGHAGQSCCQSSVDTCGSAYWATALFRSQLRPRTAWAMQNPLSLVGSGVRVLFAEVYLDPVFRTLGHDRQE